MAYCYIWQIEKIWNKIELINKIEWIILGFNKLMALLNNNDGNIVDFLNWENYCKIFEK